MREIIPKNDSTNNRLKKNISLNNILNVLFYINI